MQATTEALNRTADQVEFPLASHLTHALIGLMVTAAIALGWWVPRDLPREWTHGLALLATETPLEATVAGEANRPLGESALDREQRLVSEFLARRYRVSEQVLDRFVATAYQAGQELTLDPLLILAVAAVESRFNPVAESVFGAQGLMQIIPKFHADKLKGNASLFDPETNIQVGARILKEYLRRGGDLERALELYGGVSEANEFPYANKVITERGRLEQTVQRVRRAG